MTWWIAPWYDRCMAGVERASLGEWREEVLAGLAGRVADIGAGTGANIVHYPASVDEVVFIEPDAAMRRLLTGKLEAAQEAGTFRPGSASVLDAPAGWLPFADSSLDGVVSTLVLCTVPDAARAVDEICRVLRPGGILAFVEHVAADDKPGRLKWQRRVTPLWKRVAAGCHLARDTEQTLRDAGFALEPFIRESARKAMPLVRPMIRGIATAPT